MIVLLHLLIAIPVIELDDVALDSNLRLPPVIEISERDIKTDVEMIAEFSLRQLEKELLNPSLAIGKDNKRGEK